MIKPGVAPKRGYYLLNADGGVDGQRRAGEPHRIAAIGALLRTRELVTVAQLSKTIGTATHNTAEYQALIKGLQLARDHGISRLRVYLDSELVVDQVNGASAVKQDHLRDLHVVACNLADLFESFRVSWVPRKMNSEADRLVREALDAWNGRADIPDTPCS